MMCIIDFFTWFFVMLVMGITLAVFFILSILPALIGFMVFAACIVVIVDFFLEKKGLKFDNEK